MWNDPLVYQDEAIFRSPPLPGTIDADRQERVTVVIGAMYGMRDGEGGVAVREGCQGREVRGKLNISQFFKKSTDQEGDNSNIAEPYYRFTVSKSFPKRMRLP